MIAPPSRIVENYIYIVENQITIFYFYVFIFCLKLNQKNIS